MLVKTFCNLTILFFRFYFLCITLLQTIFPFNFFVYCYSVSSCHIFNFKINTCCTFSVFFFFFAFLKQRKNINLHGKFNICFPKNSCPRSKFISMEIYFIFAPFIDFIYVFFNTFSFFWYLLIYVIWKFSF